ncbi:LamG-like jellyroll fold domain-containing protein [Planctomycetota bacterium]
MAKKANLRVMAVAVVAILIIASSASATLTDGLVGHWEFDYGSGDTAYDSAGTNNGTIYDANWTTGQIEGALDFDGIDDYVDCGNSAELNPEYITISAWINTSAAGSYNYIVSKDKTSWEQQRVWQLSKTENDNLRFVVFKSDDDYGGLDDWNDVTGNAVLADGNWHLVTGTWDGSVIKVFVDGQEDGANNYSGFLQQGQTNNVLIGKKEDNPNNFNGSIDDVRFYNRALSSTEIQEIYTNGIPEPATIALLGFGSVSLLRKRRKH